LALKRDTFYVKRIGPACKMQCFAQENIPGGNPKPEYFQKQLAVSRFA